MRYAIIILVVLVAFYIGFKLSPLLYSKKNKGSCRNTFELRQSLIKELNSIDSVQGPSPESLKRKDQIIAILKLMYGCDELKPDYKGCLV